MFSIITNLSEIRNVSARNIDMLTVKYEEGKITKGQLVAAQVIEMRALSKIIEAVVEYNSTLLLENE